jgi:hypothetical protein
MAYLMQFFEGVQSAVSRAGALLLDPVVLAV